MGLPEVIINNGIGQPQKAVDIDTALTLTGHRWFHWKLLLIGGFTFLASGFEYTLHAYILPFAECDLKINASDMGVINALFLGGSLVSSLFWGVTADAIGRRKVLIIAAIADGILTVIVSWSNSFIMFAVIRAMGGFCVGGAATVLISYIGEFCADHIRPRNICFMGFAWTLSWMVSPGMAAVVLPLPINLETGFIIYKSWRLFVALVGIPNIIGGICICLFLPESPKYHFAKGEEEKALAIMGKMYAQNTGNLLETYPVKHLCTGNENNNGDVKAAMTSNNICTLCSTMFLQMKNLFCPPLLWSTILSSSIYVCAMFGYYGLGLWLPTIFDRFEEFYKTHPNETVSICELSRSNEDVLNATFLGCEIEKEINLSIFTNTFILGAGCFLGNVVATYLAMKMQARLVTAIFLEVSGACVLAVYFIRTPLAVLAVSTLFLATVNAGLSVHNTVAINLFPTSMRGMGVCISFLFGRLSAVLSSLVFGMLIDKNCLIPIFLVAAIILIGGGFCLLIPKSSQKARE